MLKNRKGFTLTELIVTIAVSGVFFALIGSVIYSLLSSFRNAEIAAARDEEIKAAWVLIEKTVEEIIGSGEILNVTEEEGVLSLGTDYAILIYNPGESSLMKGTNLLSLKYIQDLKVEIVNGQAAVVVLTDDTDRKHSRVYNFYGGAVDGREE